MRRPWHIAIVFCLCLAVVLAAMGWVSLTVIRLDRNEAEARRQAVLEENVRLALWRMDSAMAPLIAQESARPYFSYTAFFPADRAYTRMFAEIKQGEILMPSPLLTQVWPYILLHFQCGPDGELTSAQVPTGKMRQLAETGYTTPSRIDDSAEHLATLRTLLDRNALLRALSPEEQPPPVVARLPETGQNIEQRQGPVAQQFLNVQEWRARSQAYQQAAARQKGLPMWSPMASKVSEGVIRPVWVGDALILARQVSVNGKSYIQGCWLDWPAIKGWLISTVKDLLPAADLEPARPEKGDARARMLATLPVRLVPGPHPGDGTGLTSPMRVSLLIAWSCVLVSAAAVAALLLGAVALSERRGAFVSAVTHELRTPLTTFRTYTEMLAEGMVQDAEKRRNYLNTLRAEAERLSHLVENVLAYARLEGGRAARRVETVALGEMLNRVKDRLTQRAEQAGMRLVVEARDEELQRTVRADSQAVEQILFNLVDNACKYAKPASEELIHLQAGRAGTFVVLRVRDHGPGISKNDARRLFRPFSKSARDAAHSAPGVGLGLALSRRLARSMGGDLRLDDTIKDGACFMLTLPAADGAANSER